MSYSDPIRVGYNFNSINFANANSLAIKGPTGKRGRIAYAGVSVTTTFTNVTTSGRLQLGVSGTLAAFMSLDMGAAASGTMRTTDDVTAASLALADITENAAVLLNTVAPTGGAPAGVGHVVVVIDWY